jgi:hypothetical protein
MQRTGDRMKAVDVLGTEAVIILIYDAWGPSCRRKEFSVTNIKTEAD